MLCCLTPLSTTFQLYRGTHFIGGGNRSTQRKTLSHNVVSSTPRMSWVHTHNIRGDRH